MDIEEAIKEAKEEAKERNFVQSVDLVINLKNIDLDQPENRFSEDLTLPYQASENKVAVIGDSLVKNADNADKKIGSDELEEYFDDKSEAKKLAEEMDFFIAEAPLMPDIGKELGPVLGPRNKMPKPMQPGEDPTGRIENLKRSVSIKVGESPSVKCKIGNEEMSDNEVAENAKTIVDLIESNLPRGEHNLKDVYVKLTMGPAINAR